MWKTGSHSPGLSKHLCHVSEPKLEYLWINNWCFLSLKRIFLFLFFFLPGWNTWNKSSVRGQQHDRLAVQDYVNNRQSIKWWTRFKKTKVVHIIMQFKCQTKYKTNIFISPVASSPADPSHWRFQLSSKKFTETRQHMCYTVLQWSWISPLDQSIYLSINKAEESFVLKTLNLYNTASCFNA